MAYFFGTSPQDESDRAHRHLLMHPRNLAEFVGQAVPGVAPNLVFDQARLLTRDLPLPDWRKRENDLFFEVPFKVPLAGGASEVLVGVLVEHQTNPDPAMPLRTLVYAAGYWDDQWQAWAKRKGDKPPLVLTPVLPLVFHAGSDRWTTHRGLADLFVPPDHLRPFLPQWQPVFWHLFEQPPEALVQTAAPWLHALAVVRHEEADLATYQQVCAEVAQRLEGVAAQDKLRWHDLMCFVIGWTHHRRERGELPVLDTVLETSIMNVALREEVKTMNQAAGQTLLEWAEEHYTQIGEARGELRGQLCARRDALRTLLEDRFGPLPEAVVQRIEATEDLERLKACIRQVRYLQALEELQL